ELMGPTERVQPRGPNLNTEERVTWETQPGRNDGEAKYFSDRHTAITMPYFEVNFGYLLRKLAMMYSARLVRWTRMVEIANYLIKYGSVPAAAKYIRDVIRSAKAVLSSWTDLTTVHWPIRRQNANRVWNEWRSGGRIQARYMLFREILLRNPE